MRLPADWPFRARRLPFFYGWVVLVVSTLGILASVPGQTMGMAVFTEHFMEVLGLSRTELSMAYMLGTVGSSFFLARAGRLYDHFGARLVVVLSAVLLGLALLYIAAVDRITAGLAGLGGTGAFVMIALGYLAVRFLGQGVLTSASRNVLMEWFERRRGLVSGVRGVFVALGFSIAPPILAALIDGFGWRGSLLLLAGVCGIAFPLIALVLLRDAPEPCGLRPDGEPPAEDGSAPPRITGVPLHGVQRTPAFWVYCLSLAMHSLFGTAVTFHVVSIFAAAGRDQAEAFGYFLPMAVVSTSVNMIVSWLSDRFPLRPFLWAMLLAFTVAGTGLLLLERPLGYGLLVTGMGFGGGLWAMLTNVTWVRLFGRAHLGAIAGLNASFMVFFSAIGPALFALGLDLTGTFAAPVGLCMASFVALLAVALAVPEPVPVGERDRPSRGVGRTHRP